MGAEAEATGAAEGWEADMTRPAVPTPVEAAIDPRLFRNQREVDLIMLLRGLPEHAVPHFLTFGREVVAGASMEEAGARFFRACGLTERAAKRKVRGILSRRAA